MSGIKSYRQEGVGGLRQIKEGVGSGGSSPSNVFSSGIKLTNTSLQEWAAGQLQYDPDSLTLLADSGITGVRNNIGQEEWYLVYNNSGAQIDNGKAVFASGVDATNNVLTIGVADSSSFGTSAQVLGLATHDIPDGTLGLVTYRGIVRDFDTSALSVNGIAYLGTSGNLTNTKPLYPNSRIAMGSIVKSDVSEGQVQVIINQINRRSASKSYSFTSQGIGAGTYWKAGFYDWSSVDANLSQASATITYGTVGIAKAAHASIVASGPGVVDSGQVGLRVTGIEDSENGVQIAAQTGIVTEDITTLSADTYYETSEKFSGQVTFELYVVSGSPTTYSLDFNYGFSKYEDIQNQDFTITAFEAVWRGAANSSLDIELMHHKATGWTYAATGFEPGNGNICKKSDDQGLAGNAESGGDGAYKRVNLDTFIDGNGSEGLLIKVVAGANNTIQTMDLHIAGFSEELF